MRYRQEITLDVRNDEPGKKRRLTRASAFRTPSEQNDSIAGVFFWILNKAPSAPTSPARSPIHPFQNKPPFPVPHGPSGGEGLGVRGNLEFKSNAPNVKTNDQFATLFLVRPRCFATNLTSRSLVQRHYEIVSLWRYPLFQVPKAVDLFS